MHVIACFSRSIRLLYIAKKADTINSMVRTPHFERLIPAVWSFLILMPDFAYADIDGDFLRGLLGTGLLAAIALPLCIIEFSFPKKSRKIWHFVVGPLIGILHIPIGYIVASHAGKDIYIFWSTFLVVIALGPSLFLYLVRKFSLS